MEEVVTDLQFYYDGIKADMPKARYALNDIGTALYELRRHIEALENEHRLEDLRQRKAD